MNDIWVLSIKTSLPKVCFSANEIKTSFFAFDSFEKAREMLREKLREFAFTKNSMFDGEGHIKYFSEYIAGLTSIDESIVEYGEDDLSYKVAQNFERILEEIFSGKNTDLKEFKEKFYTDYFIAIIVNEDSFIFRGDDDGPCNGCDPVLTTNMISMEEEKDYYLYINDRFGQEDRGIEEATSELYIDLKKAIVL